MPRALTLQSTPELLRQAAKRWLVQLRNGDADARRRLEAAWPDAPPAPVLRDVQHAVAREYGFTDWRALRAALDDLALERETEAQRIDAVLRHGWQGDRPRAARLLARYPALAHADVFTAATCGDVETVRRLLAADPTLATQTGGPHTWTALAYVCFGRLDAQHAVTIATCLLDAGADPTFHFDDGWGNPFTCITGAIGLGEGVKPSHPQAAALVDLLLERGADPFDTQALYNDSIAHDDTRWLARLWDACERAGRTAAWHAIDGHVLSGRLRVGTLNYLLGNAVTNRHPVRAQWLLAHGADARTRHSYRGEPVHTVARLAGFTELVALLEAHGAEPATLTPAQAFAAAVMAGDQATARALAEATPALLRAPLLPAAAAHGRRDGVALLLALGADVHARDGDGATALHQAAFANAAGVIELLLAHGAAVDAREPRWQATPLGWAVHLGRFAAAEALAAHSRDVRALARSGRVARLDAVLRDAPALLNPDPQFGAEPTPLFSLPDDTDTAHEVATLLLDAGADRTVRNVQRQTAADAARARGLDEVAELLAVS